MLIYVYLNSQLNKKNCATGVDRTVEGNTIFTAILSRSCDVMSFYDMISNVTESQNKDLKRMLEKYVLDVCDWTKHIANTTAFANYTQGGEESCPSFLRKQCVASRAKGDWLKDKMYDSYVYFRNFIHDYVLPSTEYVYNSIRVTWINHYFPAPNSLTC